MVIKIVLITAIMLSATAVKVSCEDFAANIVTIKKTVQKLARSRRKWTSPIQYYPNSTNTFRLLISGDVETNPGPTSCQTCNKTVKINSKRVECEVCLSLNHQRCIKGTVFCIPNSRIPAKWTCPACLLISLPFRCVRDIDVLSQPVNNIDDQLNEHKSKHLEILDSNRHHLSICHLNTQSLASSFAEFEVMLNEHKFDIVTLSETWLKDNPALISYITIPGYKFEYSNRTHKRGGGVGIYIKETFRYKVRKDITNTDKSIEHIWLEVKGKTNPFLVAAFYQPSSKPNDKLTWIQKCDAILSHVLTIWNGPILVTGDTNINLLDHESNETKLYLDTIEHLGLQQHITNPTRKGRKLIDHIISNVQHIHHQDVLPCDEISDHDAVYVICNIRTPRFQPRYKYIRIEKDFNTELFLSDIEKTPFNLVYAFDSPEDQLDVFNELFLSCLNTHAPLVKQKITRPPAPWLKDLDIKAKQRVKNRLRKIARRTELEQDIAEYRHHRNEVKKLIKTAKADFFKKALSSKRPKDVWSVIHRILNPSPTKITADPDTLNVHFNTTAKRLLNSNPKSESLLKSRIQSFEDTSNMLKFQPVTYHDITKAIQSIRKDCSTGYDTIPAKFLKIAVDHIASPLCHIINACIKSNHFPKQWKVSRISPIPKIGNPKEPSDFRPISILPILSKVFEKLIMNQVVLFLETRHALSDNQCGFRKGHCTVTTCIKIRDDILKAMNRGEVTLAVMADYSKAFDTVDFETLIEKLHKIGFSKNATLLISSYLTDRLQFVQIDSNCSKKLVVTNGVPQGSILGPILFNIYVHDLNDNITGSCMQYADDTNIYDSFKPDHLDENVARMNQDLNRVAEWSGSSNLIFNAKKTKTILFGTNQMLRRRNLNNPNLYQISHRGHTIDRTFDFKILGITFAHDLSWNQHISRATSASFAQLRVLSMLKRFTPYHTRKQLSEALVLSRIDYGNAVFHNVPTYLKNRLQRVINASAGYVRKRYSRTVDSIHLNWLPAHERSEFAIAKLAWKSVHSSTWPKFLPMEMNGMSRTRAGQASNMLKCSTNVRGTFEFDGANVFNSLPIDCRSCEKFGNFCNLTKKYFIDKALARCLV